MKNLMLAAALIMPSLTAFAQVPPAAADPQAAYEGARNQLGVLKYCQEKGFVDASAVAVQEKALTLVPAGDTAKGDAAEAKGKAGTISAMGHEMSIGDGAKAQGATPEALCNQMGEMMKMIEAQLPK